MKFQFQYGQTKKSQYNLNRPQQSLWDGDRTKW